MRVDRKIRLACQILEGEVVDRPAQHMPSRMGMILRRFQKEPLCSDWGIFDPPPPVPDRCADCIASSVLHSFPPGVMERTADHPELMRMAKRRAGIYCFGNAFFLGSGKKKDRPKKISAKVREKCPLQAYIIKREQEET